MINVSHGTFFLIMCASVSYIKCIQQMFVDLNVEIYF